MPAIEPTQDTQHSAHLMLKKVATSQLKGGMFIHDFECSWTNDAFLRNRFLLNSEEDLARIRAIRPPAVVIDTSRGIDADGAPTVEAAAAPETELTAVAAAPLPMARVALAEELQRAARVRAKAVGVVRTVMADARLGRALKMDEVDAVVERHRIGNASK